ncbi:hypothetical protein HG717_16420 [Rhodococcus erythropolis]|uniref:hypothetical protein n=1 Tax=Rhodococcus erythropolis TaxID=1833 RepID=UPI001C9B73B0|nr:hypothetical protein [Rhodococcus erythropolis]MBY6385484.1 hypothetical protein [Rhodococcus erythropolis]
MSSNGEDIIRETFEKLGDAIGVQMQIPDAMITNLGAVLQAQIDLLAELQSTGRLIPTGGMALTAERVEDVRTAREELRGYRNFTGYGRSHVNQLIAAVDALFPATEPAEEDFESLIEKSSLGTESAQALISTVSPEHGRRVAQEAARREAGTKVKLSAS